MIFDDIISHPDCGDQFSRSILDIHIPYMKCITTMLQTGISSDSVTLADRPYMTATHLNAHTGTVCTQSGGAYSRHILSKGKGGTTTQKPERLTVALIHLHPRHTSIVLGRGDKLHPEGSTQIGFSVNNLVDSFYVHYLKREYSGTSQARALAPKTSRSRSSSCDTIIFTLPFILPKILSSKDSRVGSNNHLPA